MRNIFAILGALALGLGAAAQPAAAQEMRALPDIDSVPPHRGEQVALGDAADEGAEQWTRMFGQVWVRNVARPTLYPVRPLNGRGNGKAVIVVPGGGYRFVSITSEGFAVAERLAAQGYTAFVLKYRVIATPADPLAFRAETLQNFGSLGKSALPEMPEAVDDLAAAIDHVAAHASAYGIDAERIGAIGFSAGARTAIRLIEQKPAGARLDHVALIYPPMAQTVTGGPRPDLFAAIAADDPLFAQGGLTLIERWLAESDAAEFHLFSGGGHGFGMVARGTTSDRWIDDYLAWLALR